MASEKNFKIEFINLYGRVPLYQSTGNVEMEKQNDLELISLFESHDELLNNFLFQCEMILIYKDLGSIYFKENNLEEAETQTLKAIEILEKTKDKKYDIDWVILYASCKITMGDIFNSDNELELAEKSYEDSINILEDVPYESRTLDYRKLYRDADYKLSTLYF